MLGLSGSEDDLEAAGKPSAQLKGMLHLWTCRRLLRLIYSNSPEWST